MRPLALISVAILIGLIPSCRYGYELVSQESAVADRTPRTGGGRGGAVPLAMGGAEALAASGADLGGATSQAGAPASSGMGGSDEPAAFGSGPFSAPEMVTPLFQAGVANDDPSFTADLLELYFGTTRAGGGEQIWVSKRASSAEPWGVPSSVLEVNNGDYNGMPGISSDGLTLSFVRGTPGLGNTYDVYMTTRADRGSPWQEPELLEFSDPASGEYSPFISSDRLFASWGKAVPELQAELRFSERSDVDQPWSIPTTIPGLSSAFNDGEPWLSDSLLVVYFRSSRGGADYDIYTSSRDSTAEAFPTPQPDDSLNSLFDDSDPWLSQDLRYVMFASKRSGTFQIYEAFRD